MKNYLLMNKYIVRLIRKKKKKMNTFNGEIRFEEIESVQNNQLQIEKTSQKDESSAI